MSSTMADLPRLGLLTSNTSNLVAISLSFAALYIVLTTLYNAFSGPLRKIPGPIYRRVSRIPMFMSAWFGTDVVDYNTLHQKYGSVVRIGPTELSYSAGGQAFKDIYGFKKSGQAENIKDPYFYGTPFNNVHGLITADHETHSRQRRLVSHAFADKSLKEVEPMLKQWASTLKRKLGERAGSPIDMLKSYNCTTFDIMGDLTFNEGLNMLEDGEYSPWVATIFDSIKEATRVRALRLTSSFAHQIITRYFTNSPQARAQMIKHMSYTQDRVDRRLVKTPERTDLWSKILERSGQPAGKDDVEGGLSLEEHYAIASLFMIAGTETTATVLSGVTYHLTRNPQYLRKLQEELRSAYSSVEDVSLDSLARLKYMQAVLQEGMRMYPPVPSHLFRLVPKGGAVVCGEFVPEGTSMAVHHYSTYRSPDLWKNAGEFRPERWLGDAEYKDDQLDALEPFMVGPRNCLGKNLAWHEMRLLLATVMIHFDLEICEDSKDWTGQKVYTLWEKRPLMCKVTSV